MKIGYYSDLLLMDWELPPYIMIEPSEITNGDMTDFKTILLMYATSMEALPPCGKQIIDAVLWTSLKLYAGHLANCGVKFVVGVKEYPLGEPESRFLEIGVFVPKTRQCAKITHVEADGYGIMSSTIYVPRVTVKTNGGGLDEQEKKVI